MTVTEFILPHFKPETAKEALQVLRDAARIIHPPNPSVLNYRVGHVLRHEGQDVSSQYRSATGVEWDKPSSFHALLKTPAFQDFASKVMPYAAGGSPPKLFKPVEGYDRTDGVLNSAVTQVFTGAVGSNREEVEGQWKSLVDALRKSNGSIESWSGWAIEDADGWFLGLLGWKEIEEIDESTKKESVSEALERLKGVEGVEEYVVKFEE